MTTVFLIHGAYGKPNEHWFPWLKQQLESAGHQVIAPVFPTPEGHTLKNWLTVFKEIESQFSSDVIIVGHSMAPAFLLTLLETHQVRAAFFVGGFIGPLGLPAFDPMNSSFTEREFNWVTIRAHCKHFTLFNSTDDPYVPLEKGRELAKKLEGEFIEVENVKHFGMKEFPLLLEKIKLVL